MQPGYLIALAVTVLALFSFSAIRPKHLNTTQKTRDISAADSGYIFKDKALILHKAVLHYETAFEEGDTLDYLRADIPPTDTIGKFYRHTNGNYMVCIQPILYFPTPPVHYILEVDPTGNIVDKDEFSDGMYFCCWKNMREGFVKQGGYYRLKECGTGSGYCSTNLYVFESLDSPGVSTPITTQYFLSLCEDGLACYLTSSINIQNDTITAHYTSEKLKIKEKISKVKRRERFTVQYTLNKSGWQALDSTQIKNFYD